MEEKSKIADAIIAQLEHVRERPAVFTGEASERALRAYLSGFAAACRAFGYVCSREIYWQVCEERGWEINSFGPQKRMRKAGMSDQAIVDEMLVIEIETWRRSVR